MKKNLLASLALMLTSATAFAEAPALQNLTPTNVDDALKTFATLTNFRSLEPASAWAKYFGVSLGLVAQTTYGTRLRRVVPNGGDIPKFLPDANIVLALQAPWGLGVELGAFPTTDIKDIRLRQYAGNLKWTVNEVFLKDKMPVDIALRAGVSKALVGFKYSVSGLTDNVEYTNTIYNFSLMASRRFWFIEPYVAAGYTTSENKLNNEGRVTLLNQEFSVRNSIEKDFGSVLGVVGIQWHIWFFNITTQADYQYGSFNYALKLAGKF